jgi:hypothetical protein
MSDEGSNILEVEDNLEKQKLLLEQKRIDQEKELKLKELEILKKQAAGAQWTVPIVVALIGGILGLWSNFWSSQQNLNLEKERQKENLILEQEKQKGNLILEAIKTGQTKTAAANLIFLDNSGLIDLTDAQRKPLEDIAGKNPLPSLPQAGFFTTPIVPNARVYLLAGSSEKIKLFYKLRTELVNAGFIISGENSIDDPERPTQAEVRYFNDSDRAQAEIIAESIRFNSKEPALVTITAKKYKDSSAKPGYIEIWVGK